MREHIILEKLGIFYILSSRNHSRGNSPNSICRFVLFLHHLAEAWLGGGPGVPVTHPHLCEIIVLCPRNSGDQNARI